MESTAETILNTLGIPTGLNWVFQQGSPLYIASFLNCHCDLNIRQGFISAVLPVLHLTLYHKTHLLLKVLHYQPPSRTYLTLYAVGLCNDYIYIGF